MWSTLLLLAISNLLGSTFAASSEPACGQIINAPDGQEIFKASLVYECLTSVPFNAAVASKYLDYWNDTLKFQTSVSYLKNPPSEYQQPGVDLFHGMSRLQAAVDAGKFANQYEFEVALQLLLTAAHDSHLFLEGGALAVFTFASPFDIVSVSADGIEAPKVYIAEDILYDNGIASAIKTINGQDVTLYLDEVAANNSYGTLEKHADWNQLMLSGALDIQDYFSVFSGNTIIYPGDTITFGFENGTSVTQDYLALYWSQGPTGPLESGGDFYNFFVLGWWPASYDPYSDYSSDGETSSTAATYATTAVASTVTTSPTPTPSGWANSQAAPWYPATADIYQPDLDLYSGGWITGYFLNSSSTSVLSIPSFDMYDEALNTAQATVDRFINQSLARGVEKIVIDLQQNTGGQVLLAFDIFRRFFPNIEPFAGSRMRAQRPVDVMGQLFTGVVTPNSTYWSVLAADEWVATARINAETNETFASWEEFFGPHAAGDDEFTTVQRYNLTDNNFIQSALADGYEDFAVYSPDPSTSTPPYEAADIILLTDGICASTCTLFLEMMHHEAGVKVVTVGGRPTAGPMQAASGSRGARYISLETLDANIMDVEDSLLAASSDGGSSFLPNRTTANDVYIVDAGVNLRDQVRRKSEDQDQTPLQFAYEAADCRVYWTPQTVFNYTALWQYAADAAWVNGTLCVAGSTGYSGSSSSNTTLEWQDPDADADGSDDAASPIVVTNSGPSAGSSLFDIDTYLSSLTANATATADSVSSLDDVGKRGRYSALAATQIIACNATTPCKVSHQVCKEIQLCRGQAKKSICVDTCHGGKSSSCGGGSGCEAVVKGTATAVVGLQTKSTGFCVPTPTACLANGKTKLLS